MVKGERRGVVLLRVETFIFFAVEYLYFSFIMLKGAYLGIDSEDDSTVR